MFSCLIIDYFPVAHSVCRMSIINHQIHFIQPNRRICIKKRRILSKTPVVFPEFLKVTALLDLSKRKHQRWSNQSGGWSCWGTRGRVYPFSSTVQFMLTRWNICAHIRLTSGNEQEVRTQPLVVCHRIGVNVCDWQSYYQGFYLDNTPRRCWVLNCTPRDLSGWG